MDLKGTVFENLDISKETLDVYQHMRKVAWSEPEGYTATKTKAMAELDKLMAECPLFTAVNTYLHSIALNAYEENGPAKGCYLLWVQLWLSAHNKKYKNITREVFLDIRDFLSGKYDEYLSADDMKALKADIAGLLK